MNCPKCNNPINPESHICGVCGNSIEQNNSTIDMPIITPIPSNNIENSVPVNINGTANNISVNSNTTLSNQTVSNSQVNNLKVDSTNSFGNSINNAIPVSNVVPVNNTSSVNVNSNISNVSTVNTVSTSNVNTNSSPVNPVGTFNSPSPVNNVGTNSQLGNLTQNNTKKKGNVWLFVLPLVIIVLALTIYFTLFNHADTTTPQNYGVLDKNSKVTVNGIIGDVDKDWTFYEYYNDTGAVENDYQFVFQKLDRTSISYFYFTNYSYDDLFSKQYNLKSGLESVGYTNVDIESNEKNGKRYFVITGVDSEGYNCAILCVEYSDGYVLLSEGYYTSAADYTIMFQFLTSLKNDTVDKTFDSTKVPIDIFSTIED